MVVRAATARRIVSELSSYPVRLLVPVRLLLDEMDASERKKAKWPLIHPSQVESVRTTCHHGTYRTFFGAKRTKSSLSSLARAGCKEQQSNRAEPSRASITLLASFLFSQQACHEYEYCIIRSSRFDDVHVDVTIPTGCVKFTIRRRQVATIRSNPTDPAIRSSQTTRRRLFHWLPSSSGGFGVHNSRQESAMLQSSKTQSLCQS